MPDKAITKVYDLLLELKSILINETAVFIDIK